MLCPRCARKENERLEKEGAPYRILEHMDGLVGIIGKCEECGEDMIYYDNNVDRESIGLQPI